MEQVISWIALAISFGTILGFASLGETLNEKSGHLNLGIPGIMYFSAIVAYLSCKSYENSTANPSAFVVAFIAILVGFGVGGVLGLVYSLVCATFKCNQNVMGLAMTSFGVGFGKFISSSAQLGADDRLPFSGSVFSAKIPLLSDIPFVGPSFFGGGFMTYLFVLLAIVGFIFLNKTRVGLNLRAVGESPATADAAGISIMRYKYIATIVGCGLAGLGGMTYVMAYSQGLWSSNNNIEALGWLGVALVIFVAWKPIHLLWGAPLFGFLYWAYVYLIKFFQSFSIVGLSNLIQMLPYLITIVILIINSLKKRHENQPPSSLGVAYFREER